MDAARDGSTKSPITTAADVDRIVGGAGLDDELLGRFAVFFQDHEERVLRTFQRLVAMRDPLGPAAVKVAVEQLLQAPTGSGWRQQDIKAKLKVDGRLFMYANIIVVNDREEPPLECRMRALVDTGSGAELIIPQRKAHQLKLRERSQGTITGYGGSTVQATRYAPVIVKLPSDDGTGHEQTYKEADLSVYAEVCPVVQQEDLNNFAGFRPSQQQLSPEGNLQLTPVNSPPRGVISPVILGMSGLIKLGLIVKPDQALLCPVELGDEWVVA